TKSGAFDPGGHLSVYGGSHSWMQPSAEHRRAFGRLHYFLTGDYLQNSIGISPATPNGAIHDDTRQGHGFGYFEYALDAASKLSAVVGSFIGHFQIPNRPGVSPSFTVNSISEFDSARGDETQREQNHFAVLSYLRASERLSLQAAAFVRYSAMSFQPDRLADLLFNGIAQRVDRSSVATGLQLDSTVTPDPAHTLRAGAYV